MLTKEDNEILTQVGPGTMMGNLLRRYWTPALLSSEVPEPDSPPVRVRILGEDLVAFRDTEGRVGLFKQACPHRGASMFFGRNEEAGLRCVYHGWKFDVNGECVDMPSEPAESNFKNKVRIAAYPTHESGGHRLGLLRAAGEDDRLPRLRLRCGAAREVVRDQDHRLLQLGAAHGGQPGHLPHLVAASVPGRARLPGRRHGRRPAATRASTCR